MLKAVAMVTSSPRITVPLCLATEREKARQRLGESEDVGRRGRLVSGGAIDSKDVPSRDQPDSRKQCGSIQKENKNNKISLYRPFAWA